MAQEKATVGVIFRFVINLLLGSVSFYFIGGLSSFTMLGLFLIPVFWWLGALILGGFQAKGRPKVKAIWHVGYALPIFFVGLISFDYKSYGYKGPYSYYLMSSSIVTLIFGLWGVWLGRKLSASIESYRLGKVTASKPVDY